MIRLATEGDFPAIPDNECLVRILGLRFAYGEKATFICYYTDGDGGLMSLMDGVAVLSLSELTEEWEIFLNMNPEVFAIHCSKEIGDALMRSQQWKGRVGDVMIYEGDTSLQIHAPVDISPGLSTVYELLREHFPGISVFEYWYPDVSHRIRHGCCHISAFVDAEKVVSTAMTVAETETAAILGQVATHPEFRRRGLAGTCIKSVVHQCKGKELYILPINENARLLYEKLGFVTVGGWAELQRT